MRDGHSCILDLELEVWEQGDRGGKVCNQIALLNYNNHHCHPKCILGRRKKVAHMEARSAQHVDSVKINSFFFGITRPIKLPLFKDLLHLETIVHSSLIH